MPLLHQSMSRNLCRNRNRFTEAPVYDAPLQNQDDAFFDSLDAAGDVSNVPEGSVFDAEASLRRRPDRL